VDGGHGFQKWSAFTWSRQGVVFQLGRDEHLIIIQNIMEKKFHGVSKIRGLEISSIAERLLAPQEEFRSVELFILS
jgi:hypothetical protein